MTDIIKKEIEKLRKNLSNYSELKDYKLEVGIKTINDEAPEPSGYIDSGYIRDIGKNLKNKEKRDGFNVFRYFGIPEYYFEGNLTTTSK